MSYIVNSDCFDEFQNIDDHTVDLVVVDLPYGQTACKWDVKIDLHLMWKELKRICKRDAVYVFFTTTKFGIELINSNPKWFRYDIVWEKSRTAGFLSANKMPLRTHEMIYIFADVNNVDLDNSRNIGLRAYAERVKEFINRPIKEIDLKVGNQGIHHFYSFKSTQFGLPTQKTYDSLIKEYKIDEMDGFRTLDDLKGEWETSGRGTVYNPQKTEGEPYKSKAKDNRAPIYGDVKGNVIDNKGDRHPTSIIKFNSPHRPVHSTQKPVDLCEWLIKTYSDEGDTVLDFCMGSGSTIVACKNTNREYIGIEKDEDIFNKACERLEYNNNNNE